LVTLLKFDVLPNGSEVVAPMGPPCGLDARKHALCHGLIQTINKKEKTSVQVMKTWPLVCDTSPAMFPTLGV
jgi:hypothetical protein